MKRKVGLPYVTQRKKEFFGGEGGTLQYSIY